MPRKSRKIRNAGLKAGAGKANRSAGLKEGGEGKANRNAGLKAGEGKANRNAGLKAGEGKANRNAGLKEGDEGKANRNAGLKAGEGKANRNAGLKEGGEEKTNRKCPSTAQFSEQVTIDSFTNGRRSPTFPNGTKPETIKEHLNYFERFWTTASEEEYAFKRYTNIQPPGSKYVRKCFTERSCPVCKVCLTQGDFATNVTSRRHKENKLRQVTNKRLQIGKLHRSVCVTGFPREAAKNEKIAIGELVGELFYFGAVDAVVGVNDLQQDCIIVEFETPWLAYKAETNLELYYGTSRMELTQIDSKEVAELKEATVQKALDKLYSAANSAVTADDRKRALVDLANMAAIPQEELEDKKRIMQHIAGLLGRCYPLATCTMFGSSVSGLGIRGTDVDALVDLGPYKGRKLKEDLPKEEQWARIVSKQLIDSRAYENVKAITGCRVPIVTFTDIRTEIEVDLAFSGEQGIFNTRLLKFYTELHPIIKPYLMLLRLWGRGADVVKAKQPRTHLTNYALTLLGLFFLMGKSDISDECDGQRIKMLPSIEELRKAPHSQVIIDGYEYGFNDKVTAHQPVHCPYQYPSDLVSKFFSFYAHFKFVDFILCPFNGNLIHKISLPKNWSTSKFVDNTICVQDPFDHGFNATKNIRPPGLRRFRATCQRGIQSLEDAINSGADFREFFQSSWYDEINDPFDEDGYIFG